MLLDTMRVLASSSCYFQQQCHVHQRRQYTALLQTFRGQTSACQPLASLCRSCLSLACSSAPRTPPARRARHIAAPSAHLGHGHIGMSRDLLDCWPGCSCASWMEASLELGGLGSAFAGGSNGMALSAAALAEPPGESAAAEPPEPGSAGNSITRICSPEEFEEQLASHGSDLIVLMCKARSCRPCKMFTRKFQRIAEAYPNVTFLEIYGDDTKETRKLMIAMSIRVTPNFRLYRDGELVDQLSGINETNLRNAVEKALHPEHSTAEDVATS